MRDWTERETALLTELWAQNLSGPEIADRIGRSPHAVWCRKSYIGLGRRAVYWGHWSEDLVEALSRLWKAGFSATEIRAQVPGINQFSRNAVLGKLSRLGLLRTVRQKVGKPPRPKRQPRRIKPRETIFTIPVELLPDPSPVLNIELPDLETWHCRYPIGEDRITFCGQPIGYRSYCLHHARVCYGNGS